MKVIRKQSNSKMCLICGLQNKAGLKAPFYEMEDNSVVTIFRYNDIHQSYPERVHGGMISSLLDELIGRAIWVYEPTIWGVTATLNVKFRKPVPLNEELIGKGVIIENKKRLFKGVGYIYSKDLELLAEAEAVYVKLPLDEVVHDKCNHEDINIYVEDDIKEINI